jgi:hypothetical protein
MIHFRHSTVTVAGNIAAMLLDRILLLIALAFAAATLALLVVASCGLAPRLVRCGRFVCHNTQTVSATPE